MDQCVRAIDDRLGLAYCTKTLELGKEAVNGLTDSQVIDSCSTEVCTFRLLLFVYALEVRES